MKRFTQLYAELDASNRTGDKVAALRRYFAEAPPENAAWGLWLLLGNRFRSAVPSAQLRAWVAEECRLPGWLVDDCYERVGDLAETLALLLPLEDEPTARPLAEVIGTDVQGLGDSTGEAQREAWRSRWGRFDRSQALIFHKMLTGGFRVGVSRALVTRGLAEAVKLPPAVVAHRLMGHWQPTADWFRGLACGIEGEVVPSRPYPFYLASPVAGVVAELGPVEEWWAEWKWDGIRGQLIKRGGALFLWSRGEELVSEQFPEILAAAAALPDGTVLDGEILAWRNDEPLGFHVLQGRLGRKRVTAAMRAAAPVVFLAYDCLEAEGRDCRTEPFLRRRERLEEILRGKTQTPLRISPEIPAKSWEELAKARETSRARGVEGLMLKSRQGPYLAGRVKGEWWKWKVDPFTADLVMVYAQAGHGRRAQQFTDYTLAAWDEGVLTPVAKAYSGLSKAEIAEVDRWVKAHTLARHGPVRTVPGKLVFEIAFEGVQLSGRHKSGLALRFPRIHRWRRDKPAEEAETVAGLRALSMGFSAGVGSAPRVVQLEVDFGEEAGC